MAEVVVPNGTNGTHPRAVQLLGSRLVLTGIRPEVAQTMVGLGIQLGPIVTYSTLQAGLANVYTPGVKGARP